MLNITYKTNKQMINVVLISVHKRVTANLKCNFSKTSCILTTDAHFWNGDETNRLGCKAQPMVLHDLHSAYFSHCQVEGGRTTNHPTKQCPLFDCDTTLGSRIGKFLAYELYNRCRIHVHSSCLLSNICEKPFTQCLD